MDKELEEDTTAERETDSEDEDEAFLLASTVTIELVIESLNSVADDVDSIENAVGNENFGADDELIGVDDDTETDLVTDVSNEVGTVENDDDNGVGELNTEDGESETCFENAEGCNTFSLGWILLVTTLNCETCTGRAGDAETTAGGINCES